MVLVHAAAIAGVLEPSDRLVPAIADAGRSWNNLASRWGDLVLPGTRLEGLLARAAAEVRAAYHRLVAQGWTDALRTLHPGERIYTFWDYFRNAYARNAGLRIDHLLLSPAVAGRLVAAGVDRDVRGWEKSSDHAPTWIELSDS